MGIITAKELIEEVYRRIAQDPDIAQSANAATDDNPNYPREVVLAYINDERAQFVERMSMECDLFTASDIVDLTSGNIALPDNYLSGLDLVVYQNGRRVKILEPRSEKWLDEHSPQWRDQTADIPSYYILKADPDTGAPFVQVAPTLTGTITNGLYRYFTARLDDLVDDTDAAVEFYNFPQVQRKLIPFGVLGSIIQVGSTEAADQRAAAYMEMREQQMGVARRVARTLARRTHTNFPGNRRG